jgi:hypothetical protein
MRLMSDRAYAYAYGRLYIYGLLALEIDQPSSYKSSFSYKTSDDAETHDPSTHATACPTTEIKDALWKIARR